MKIKDLEEFLNESQLSNIVTVDQKERNEYDNFVKTKMGGDYENGAKEYARLKNRNINDIFGDLTRLNSFMNMKFDFTKFDQQEWHNYWLLSQHCDFNRNFQAQALKVIAKYLGTNSTEYKYLYDRISCGRSGSQKFGTQKICQTDIINDSKLLEARKDVSVINK